MFIVESESKNIFKNVFIFSFFFCNLINKKFNLISRQNSDKCILMKKIKIFESNLIVSLLQLMHLIFLEFQNVSKKIIREK